MMMSTGFFGRPQSVRGCDNRSRFGEEAFDLIANPLDPRAAGDKAVFGAAFGAFIGRGHHMAAMVAGEAANQSVFDHPCRAIGAFEAVPTIAAQRKGRIATAIEEQQALFAALQPLFQCLEQCWRNPCAALGLILRKVDGFNARKFGGAEAGRDFEAFVAPYAHHMAAFERGCGTRQHHRKAFEAPAHHCDVAGMVTHAIFLLETDLMGLIDDNQPGIGKGQEQGRAGACNDLHAPLGHTAPDTAALRLFHPRMPGCRFNPETRLEALEKRLGESNFRK